ncbi:uncharacterized protein DEA37_0014547 [Paragonimus westermani]|uniref:Uncharacterized protein n=1 Tax=Paragonimus westermani TaxID=34504 RepID=A0A5J4N9B1_9TREM|nr:uncharacterized protein DEA37_0014547 [Paragonimus westermani]
MQLCRLEFSILSFDLEQPTTTRLVSLLCELFCGLCPPLSASHSAVLVVDESSFLCNCDVAPLTRTPCFFDSRFLLFIDILFLLALASCLLSVHPSRKTFKLHVSNGDRKRGV